MATEQIHTYCTMCISRCGVIATVKDGRFEKVSVDPEHPNGCICVKGTAAPEIVYSSDRLRHPMKRTRPKGDADPGWVPISWDEAMSNVAGRLLEIRQGAGPEAVVFGRATPAGGSSVDFEAWLTRLANAFGSPNVLTPNHICTWNRASGAKHTYGVQTPDPDADNASIVKHQPCQLIAAAE
jgi:anaerobic selenocysteine-containing dehydrogenase